MAARPLWADPPLQLDALIAPEHGAVSCWARTYDSGHLARHPQQTVTRMRLALDLWIDPQGGARSHGFALSVARRGEEGPASAGGLCHDRADGVGCYVDCDGGGFLLRRSQRADALLLDMRHLGWIALRDCDEDEGDAPRRPPLTPGRDDRVFLLYRVEARHCADPPGL